MGKRWGGVENWEGWGNGIERRVRGRRWEGDGEGIGRGWGGDEKGWGGVGRGVNNRQITTSILCIVLIFKRSNMSYESAFDYIYFL